VNILTAEATEHPASHPLVPWWSFSKTVLSAAALVLVDRHQLDLDASIGDRPYTLRHLLQHTSGLPDYGPISEYHRAVAAGDAPWTLDELLRQTNSSTLLSAPGERFLYSNVGYLFVAPEDFDATVWGNVQRYDPRWAFHGCIVGSLPAAERACTGCCMAACSRLRQ